MPLAETLLAGWLLARAGIAVAQGRHDLRAGARRRPRDAGRQRHALSGALRCGAVRQGRQASGGARAPRRRRLAVALVEAAQARIADGTSIGGDPLNAVTLRRRASRRRQGRAGRPRRAGAAADGRRRARHADGRRAGGDPRALPSPTPTSASPSSGRSPSSRPCSTTSRGSPARWPPPSPPPARPPTRSPAPPTLRRGRVPRGGLRQDPRRRGRHARARPSPIRCWAPSASPRSTSLHRFTRRLWAWRDDFGNESVWAVKLGNLVAAKGADGLWPHAGGAVRRDAMATELDLRSDPPAARVRRAARGGARLPRRGDRGRHLQPARRRHRRRLQRGVQPQGRRQGLDRHDLAQEIRRPRAQLPRALRRHRGVPRRQRAGAAALRRRPPERPGASSDTAASASRPTSCRASAGARCASPSA